MHVIKLFAAGALCQLVATTAQAQQPVTLTLACKGTATDRALPDVKRPLSMGIIVNFTTRTLQGFGMPGSIDYPVMITAANEVMVLFSGHGQVLNSVSSTDGVLDRVTGDLEATVLLTYAKTGEVADSTYYALQCRPT
jgi:hypothetical protein